MTWIEALLLGIIQGLTEFLPVSSSGHLEIGKTLLGVEVKENMLFTVVVHGATVLSTILVMRKDIIELLLRGITLKKTPQRNFIVCLCVSMIPVLFIGLFFKDQVESLFNGNLLLVGIGLLCTAVLLAFTFYAKPKKREINFLNAFLIGVAQSVAVVPGISRSGATIATGLLAGVNKEKAAKFSFLMVLIPIIGANLKTIYDGDLSQSVSISTFSLLVGFLAAFISGVLACRWMLNVVKKGKLIYFALYCALVGLLATVSALMF